MTEKLEYKDVPATDVKIGDTILAGNGLQLRINDIPPSRRWVSSNMMELRHDGSPNWTLVDRKDTVSVLVED